MTDHLLIERINDILPQTQCGKCGFSGCKPYARAMVQEGTPINQCPPGKAATIALLAKALNRDVIPLNPENGQERPPQVAYIREAECIGCTKCIKACPLDAIMGAAQCMHTVIQNECSGCDLCIAPCPVDCIELIPVPDSSQNREKTQQAQQYKRRFQAREQRLERLQAEKTARRMARKPVQVAPAALAPTSTISNSIPIKRIDAQLKKLSQQKSPNPEKLQADIARLKAQKAALLNATDTANS